MKLRLYHGSTKNIVKPIYGAGKLNNDYGQAFYCTEDIEMAREWACVDLQQNGIVNIYEIDADELSMLHIAPPEYNVLNWLAILLDNRQFRVDGDMVNEGKKFILERFSFDYQKADILKGYRADDSYFSFANAFLNNGISIEKLREAMYYGNLGEQIAIRSEKAFSRLEYQGAEVVDSFKYFPKRTTRDQMAREQFRESRAQIGYGHYLIDIMREDWRNDDERLRGMLHL